MRVAGQPLRHGPALFRYVLVVCLSLSSDIAVGWVAINVGAGDVLASGIGIAVGFLLSFEMHARFTFASPDRSIWRMGIFAVVNLVVWLARLSVLSMLGPALPGSGWQAPVRLGLAAAICFPLGFTLSRLAMTRGGPPASTKDRHADRKAL